MTLWTHLHRDSPLSTTKDLGVRRSLQLTFSFAQSLIQKYPCPSTVVMDVIMPLTAISLCQRNAVSYSLFSLQALNVSLQFRTYPSLFSPSTTDNFYNFFTNICHTYYGMFLLSIKQVKSCPTLPQFLNICPSTFAFLSLLSSTTFTTLQCFSDARLWLQDLCPCDFYYYFLQSASYNPKLRYFSSFISGSDTKLRRYISPGTGGVIPSLINSYSQSSPSYLFALPHIYKYPLQLSVGFY